MKSYSRRELYAAGECLGESVTRKEGGRIIYGGGGGGPSGPTQSTTVTSNIPEYAKPYVTNMFEATQQQLFTGDKTEEGGFNITGFRPYTPYSTDVRDYVAGFSPLQQQAQFEAGAMQQPGQFALGSGLIGSAGIRSIGAAGGAGALGQQALGYGGMGAGYGSQAAGLAPTAQAFGQQAANIGAEGMGYGALGAGYGGMGAGYGSQAAGLAPTAQAFGQQAADIGAEGMGYGALGAGYGGMGVRAAEQGFGAGSQYAQNITSPGTVQAYMSPYQQAVTDVAKNAAVREAQMAQNAQNLGAARQGTYGGARQLLAQTERERNLLSNLSNIQAQGSQSAYDRAIQAQQFGANLGIQGLQAGYGGLGLGMQGAGLGLQGLGTALQGQQARMAGLGQAGQFLGQGMQGAQTGMQGAGLGLQGLGTALQGQQARMAGLGQAGQFLGQGMQGAQTGMQGVQGAIGAGQLGLQGYGQALTAGSQLGQLGATQQAADIARQTQMSTMGAQQQALEQQKINQAIQDYATQQQYPMMQLGFMSNMLRGLPLQSQTTQGYQAPPSQLAQLAGLGTAGIGAYGLGKAVGAFKEGGQVTKPKVNPRSRQLASAGLGGLSMLHVTGKL